MALEEAGVEQMQPDFDTCFLPIFSSQTFWVDKIRASSYPYHVHLSDCIKIVKVAMCETYYCDLQMINTHQITLSYCVKDYIYHKSQLFITYVALEQVSVPQKG